MRDLNYVVPPPLDWTRILKVIYTIKAMIEENSQKRSGQYYVRYLLPQAKCKKNPLK